MTIKKQEAENKLLNLLKGPTMGYTDNFPERAMWMEIANQLNGEFKIKQTPGQVIEMHNITIPHKKWNIQISVSDSRPLKFRILFSSSIHFNLVLSWEDFIERIIKKFSKPEIELGSKKFDNRYLVKSNRPDLVKDVISSEIQEILLKHDVYSLAYTANTTKKTAELISVIQRSAGDSEMLYELIATYKLLIDKLEKFGIIQ